MLAAIAVLTTGALLVKTTAELLLAAPVDAGPLQLRLLDNPGVAFGFGATLPPWLVAALTGAVTAAVLAYAWGCGWRQPAAGRWAFTLIIIGATLRPFPSLRQRPPAAAANPNERGTR